MCLDDQILNTYIDGELSEPWRSGAEEHLSHCKACADRAEAISHLRNVVRRAAVTAEEISPRKDRVLAILEKNTLSRQKKQTRLGRIVNMKMGHLVGMAAAYTVVFVGAWSLFAGHGEKNIPIAAAQNAPIEISNITPVRSVQPERQKTLDDFSLEQILQYLDAKGYNVDLTLKGIQPIPASGIEEIEEIESDI